MSLPSSRIPPLGNRKTSFRSSLSASFASARSTPTSKMAPPTPVRPTRRASIQTPSPVKRLQFSLKKTESDNQTLDQYETQKLTYREQTPPAPMPFSQSDNIRVFVRIRPSSSHESSKCLEVAPDARGVTLAPASQHEKRFSFDHVFAETCDQKTIFDETGRLAVENTINGYNGSIFAYGQTGSGKTFTMLGGATETVEDLRLSSGRGLTPRILDYLFARLACLARERNPGALESGHGGRFHYTLSCSYLEIYNEKIFDLLEPRGTSAAHQPKHLREDGAKHVYVDQLREIDVTSQDEALTLLQLGAQHRHVSSTDMNRESSRSHAVFSLKLVLDEQLEDGSRRTRRSCLHLVDLAGSEKQRQTRVQGKRLKEAAQINKSLSALGNVIMALVEVSNGQKRHVHYRDSKLTFLLRDALGGNAITSMVATIAPDEKFFTETLSTLKFAQRAKFIKNKAVQNEDAETLVPLLKQQIETLKQELATLKSGQKLEKEEEEEESEEETRRVAKRVGKPLNRWEPAGEMMEKLLRAATECMATGGDEREAVERRCDRLEMLLYRMICRFEEYKEVTFDPERYKSPSRRSSHVKASKLPGPPRLSMLPTPKRYSLTGRFVADNQDQWTDDEETNGLLVAAEKRVQTLQKQVQEQEKQMEHFERRAVEAEAENDLIRHELCALLEWKALVEDERRRGSENGTGGVMMPMEQTPGASSCTDEMFELREVVQAYRTFFDDVMDVISRKRVVFCLPRSPKSSSSVRTDTNSSYPSGDESEMGDECVSLDGWEASEEDCGSEGGGMKEWEREVQRVTALGTRVGRQWEGYHETMQRLEKELQATQDELETASAASKFAEFQLQQVRTLDDGKVDALAKLVRTQREAMYRVVREQCEEEKRVLEIEWAEARRKVVGLEQRVRDCSERGEEEEKGMAEKLDAAKKRVETIEADLKACDGPLLGLDKGIEERVEDWQTLVMAALEDNAKLLEILRDFQGKRRRLEMKCGLFSSLGAREMGGKEEEEGGGGKDETKSDELARLRRELTALRVKPRGGGDAVTSFSTCGPALTRPVETSQQVALERATLRMRLHRAQETTARLEEELQRVRQNVADDRCNGALSSDFLCGI